MGNFGNNRRGGSDRGGSSFRRDSGSSFRRDFGPREMHKATCAECNQECEVPFKPTEGKPVFCRECYKKRKGF